MSEAKQKNQQACRFKRSMPLRLPDRLQSPLAALLRGASNTFSNVGCPFLERLEIVLAKFETREGTPDATPRQRNSPVAYWWHG